MTGLVEILLAIGAGVAALFALIARSRHKGRRETEEKIEAQAAREREAILSEAAAEAEIVRGTGEAEALEVLAEAYSQDPAFYRFLRSLDSYESIVDEDTTLFIPSDSALLEVLYGE